MSKLGSISVKELFNKLNVNSDKVLDKKDLEKCTNETDKQILRELGITEDSSTPITKKDLKRKLKSEYKENGSTIDDLIKRAEDKANKVKQSEVKQNMGLEQKPKEQAPVNTDEAVAESANAANAAAAEKPVVKNEKPKTYVYGDPEADNAKEGDFAVKNDKTYKFTKGEWKEIKTNNQPQAPKVYNPELPPDGKEGDFAVRNGDTYKMVNGEWKKIGADGATLIGKFDDEKKNGEPFSNNEILEFWKTHTDDEVKNKYAVGGETTQAVTCNTITADYLRNTVYKNKEIAKAVFGSDVDIDKMSDVELLKKYMEINTKEGEKQAKTATGTNGQFQAQAYLPNLGGNPPSIRVLRIAADKDNNVMMADTQGMSIDGNKEQELGMP